MQIQQQRLSLDKLPRQLYHQHQHHNYSKHSEQNSITRHVPQSLHIDTSTAAFPNADFCSVRVNPAATARKGDDYGDVWRNVGTLREAMMMATGTLPTSQISAINAPMSYANENALRHATVQATLALKAASERIMELEVGA
jgi:hypothetical protein